MAGQHPSDLPQWGSRQPARRAANALAVWALDSSLAKVCICRTIRQARFRPEYLGHCVWRLIVGPNPAMSAIAGNDSVSLQ